MKAALDGTKEVMGAVVTSVLTTVFAFSTLLFVGGDMEMMEEMAFCVIGCLLFSLVEAFLILPSHLASKKILKDTKKNKSKIRTILERFVQKLKDFYESILKWVLKNYRIHVWGPFAFIVIVIVLFNSGWIRWTFFPSIPFDNILVEFSYKPGERETRTENFLWYCDSIINDYNEELIEKYNDTLITYTAISVGSTESLGEVGSHVGSIRISIKENQLLSTVDMSNDIKQRISKDSVKFLEKFSVGGQERFGKSVSVSLQSEDPEQLQIAANWFKDQLRIYPEVKDVLDNMSVGA